MEKDMLQTGDGSDATDDYIAVNLTSSHNKQNSVVGVQEKSIVYNNKLCSTFKGGYGSGRRLFSG
jgi:hypothetical protein